MKPGEIISRDNTKTMVLAWRDKRAAKAIAIKHDASVQTVEIRKHKGGVEKEKVDKPVCIICQKWTWWIR